MTERRPFRVDGWTVVSMLTVAAGVAAAGSSSPVEMFVKTWVAGAVCLALLVPLARSRRSGSREHRHDGHGPRRL